MRFFYALGICISSYLIYKSNQIRKTKNVALIHSNSILSKLFSKMNSKLLNEFQSYILVSPHLQTIFLEIMTISIRLLHKLGLPSGFTNNYSRELFPLSDGGQISVDTALDTVSSDKTKILVILPGITSWTEDYYIRDIVKRFSDEYICKVLMARGNGFTDLKNQKLTGYNNDHDMSNYINHLAKENQDKKIYLIGYSFGGFLLVRFLGQKDRSRVPDNIACAVGISYPSCIKTTVKHCESNFFGLYSHFTYKNCKDIVLRNIDTCFKNEKDDFKRDEVVNKLKKCNYMSEFHRFYSAPSLDHKTVDEYYDNSRLHGYIERITTPFLSIFARDDPIVPTADTPFEILQQSKNCTTVVTNHGGHIAFFGGGFQIKRILGKPIQSFFDLHSILTEEDKHLISS